MNIGNKIKDLILNASMGIFLARQFPKIGHFTNKQRLPGVENLTSKDLQQIPDWFSFPKRKRSRFVCLGRK